MLKSTFLAVFCILVNSSLALSQPVNENKDVIVSAPPASTTDGLKHSYELSVGAQNLSGGYGAWRDLTLRGTYKMPAHTLQGEVSLNRRFNQSGAFVGVSDTYIFNEDWFGSIALGAGDGAFYLPRYRADAALYKKWLTKSNLVSSIGVGYYAAPDSHTDQSLSLGLAYYFESPWIVEGGIRFNRSNPGSIQTHQQFVAVTYGRDKQDLIIARYGWGKEGYLAIAADTQLVDFRSREASLAWRHWLNPHSGFLIGASYYTNPSYRRTGLNVGLFNNF